MTKRMVEIDDSLDDLIANVKSEIMDNAESYFKQNTDVTEWDTYYQAELADAIHEIVDTNTPIYYSEIDGLYYLYGDEAETAYRNAGFGDGKEENHRQVALYCLIEEKAWDYVRDLESAFNEWLELEDDEKTTDKLIEMLKEVK
jgi:hypothetical protein